jgi:expansin (peptidoglycan-binding protein)
MLPALALLIFTGLVMVALAAGLGAWSATWREAAFAADAGATAGAAMLDEAAAYSGILALDPARAEAVAVGAALQARPRPERSARGTADPARVCVTVSQPFDTGPLRSVGIGPVEVTATACASPARG